MIELYVIMIFIIAAAIAAVTIRDTVSAIISLGAAGLGVSLAFLVLKAPDLAITQFVIEIITVIIVVRATVDRKKVAAAVGRPRAMPIVLGVIFIGAFLAFAAEAVVALPEFGHPLLRVSRHYLEHGARETGAANIVAAIILNYRGYDTLGEATVLFTAVIGVLAVLFRPAKGGQAMSRPAEPGMTVLVKTITRLTVGLILLYGLYIVAHGHLSPGGGFAGGTIIALSFIHLVLAFGREQAFRTMNEARASFFEGLGAMLFWIIAALGFAGGWYFYNFLGTGRLFDLFSAGIIPLGNIAICLKVGAGLYLAFLALVLFKSGGEES